MAAQRPRARCGMIRRRADVVASKTGNCRSDTRVSTRATGTTPETRRFQATSVMASWFSNPIPGTYVQYPGLQGGGALSDA